MNVGSFIGTLLKSTLIVLSCVGSVNIAHANPQHWKIIVGVPPGGAVDHMARLLASQLQGYTGERYLVENKPGAQARIAADHVKRAADERTLLMTPGVLLSLYPHTFNTLNYDPFQDFKPVAAIAKWDLALAVAADSPTSSLSQYLKALQTQTDSTLFGVAALGNAQHLAGLALGEASQNRFEAVGFKGGQEVVTALAGGQISAAILNLSEMLPLHRSGKIKILGLFSAQRNDQLPAIPTISETVGTSLVVDSWIGLYAPRSINEPDQQRLNQLVQRALREQSVRQNLETLSMTALPGTPAELDALGKREHAFWQELTQSIGFAKQ